MRAVWVALIALACEPAPAAEPPPRSLSREAPLPASAAPSAPAPAARRAEPDAAQYPWLGSAGVPKPVDTLLARFAPPRGFARMKLGERSFGGWLRTLPLAAPETPVRSHAGALLLEADDPRIAAVAAIDVGVADLQQCADAVMRLHAEWAWSLGRRDMSYRAASGLALPFERYARGERIHSRGASIEWAPGGRRVSDHAGFRKYLDSVFAWANTVSLERQAKPVKAADLRPGDFFILPGNPGHTVIVLDIAANGERKLALLGQSFMPAQNVQVLRPSSGQIWFELDPASDVRTPFWKPFPWTSLRRLD